MKEKEFDPKTMKLATAEDIQRIFFQFYGYEVGDALMMTKEQLYRVQWKQRIQPTDPHRTMFVIAPIVLAEAERIEREMRGEADAECIEIVENES